jgi:hypothetical protein
MLQTARKMIEVSISAAVADLSQLPPVNWSPWMARFLLELRDSLENPAFFDAAWEQAKKRVDEAMTEVDDGREMS